MKAPTPKQLMALSRSKDGKVRAGGRGAKQTILGLEKRGLVTDTRLDITAALAGEGALYVAEITTKGRNAVGAVR